MGQPTIGDERIELFQASVNGDVIWPGDADYDDARTVWNGMIDKYPKLIVRCRGTTDVIHAVEFARENDLRAAVRGGGHNVAGTAVCDDGLVIDLSEMTAVWVNPDERTAWVQGGATWADVDHETQTFGLATPGGVVSDTGVAGLTLGGGIGHLRCKFGLSCDNLASVDIVTADGEYLTASNDENEDLFWGLRGGVATSGSPPDSSSTSTPSDRMLRLVSCSIRVTGRPIVCGHIVNTSRQRPTRLARSPRPA